VRVERGRSGLLAVLLAGGTGIVLGVIGLLKTDADAPYPWRRSPMECPQSWEQRCAPPL
jgi:hypothetical protein